VRHPGFGNRQGNANVDLDAERMITADFVQVQKEVEFGEAGRVGRLPAVRFGQGAGRRLGAFVFRRGG